MIWANKAQEKINELVNPILLNFYDKKNIRSLTASEYKELESLKTKILLALDPNSSISETTIAGLMEEINLPKINNLYHQYYSWLKTLSAQLDDSLSVEDIKQAKTSFYLLVYNNLNQENNYADFSTRI